ncbi:ABC transporter permease [Facklamia hominis]|uniref:ABC transporter permease n=1 Tax=Facklamia hominis TaxID=178214 RepID=UPI0028893547|nr:ABC transporter permease [Facklamia hominis]WPJ91102.1 ABC transporter permease [Facklamia hominis]
MGDLTHLFNHRLNKKLKEIGKYSRLIVNDHFSVIMLVILGFVALSYREFLNYLSQPLTEIIKLALLSIIMLFFALSLSLGQPYWFNHLADPSYLFARGDAWRSYWKKALTVTAVLPLIGQLLAFSMMLPILVTAFNWAVNQCVGLLVLVLIFKVGQFINLYLNTFNSIKVKYGFLMLIRDAFFFSIVWMLGTLISYPILLLSIFNIVYLFFAYLRLKKVKSSPIDLSYAVEASVRSNETFYRFVGIFAQVPQIKSSVKKNPVCEVFLPFLAGAKTNLYSYYLTRALLRNENYVGIIIRTTCFFAMTLLILPSNGWILAIFGALAFWVTISQLVGLYSYPDYQVLFSLYPGLDNEVKLQTLMGILGRLLGVQALFYFIILIFKTNNVLEGIMVGMAWATSQLALIKIYIPYRLKKKKTKKGVSFAKID